MVPLDKRALSDGTETRRKASLILLDVMMPGMDGFEVCGMIRQDQALHKIPMVMLTAMDSQDLHSRACAAGAELCMTKPFWPERLLNAVNIALQNVTLGPSTATRKSRSARPPDSCLSRPRLDSGDSSA